MINVGIIGLGTVSQFYLAALSKHPSVRLTAVCDVDPQRLALDCFGDIARFACSDDLIADGRVDAVIVCLPNNLHFPICTSALNAGKHVCCEKPLSLSPKECEMIIGRAGELRLGLLTACHRRHNSNVSKAARAVDGRRIVEARAWYQENICQHAPGSAWYFSPECTGGGCIADNGPNVFDVLSLFVGDLSVVSCSITATRNGVDYGAIIGLRSLSGAPAIVSLDWEFDGERKEIEFTCEDGSIVRLDFLAEYAGWKSSLWTEYEVVVDEFVKTACSRSVCSRGLNIAQQVETAYKMAKWRSYGTTWKA
jgi:predicted dehydrogenase